MMEKMEKSSTEIGFFRKHQSFGIEKSGGMCDNKNKCTEKFHDERKERGAE
ncbi:MAG: hypothetical protein IJE08_06375 [Clostridia bacterium]|nr:hypothetical protein [Clostridia bacterium]